MPVGYRLPRQNPAGVRADGDPELGNVFGFIKKLAKPLLKVAAVIPGVGSVAAAANMALDITDSLGKGGKKKGKPAAVKASASIGARSAPSAPRPAPRPAPSYNSQRSGPVSIASSGGASDAQMREIASKLAGLVAEVRTKGDATRSNQDQIKRTLAQLQSQLRSTDARVARGYSAEAKAAIQAKESKFKKARRAYGVLSPLATDR